MHVEEFWDCLRIAASKATLGRYPKLRNDLLCRRHTARRPINPVCVVNQAQKQHGFGLQLQTLQWNKIRTIITASWNGQMYPLNRSCDCCTNAIRKFYTRGGILRLDNVFMARIAVTQVHA